MYRNIELTIYVLLRGEKSMIKRGFALLILTVLTSAMFIGTAEGPEEPNIRLINSTFLEKLDDAHQDEHFEIIVQFESEVRDRDIKILKTLGFDVGRTFHVIPAVFAIGSKSSIIRLSQLDRVKHIEENEELHYMMDESTSTVNATKVWASQIVDSMNRVMIDTDGNPLHIDGKDVTVVVVDSGIDAGHPDLDYGTKTIMNLKSDLDGSYTEAENTDTSSGHGTHCSGTIAGNGDASGGARRGVAPEANLIGISTGEAVAILNALGALEWVYDHSRMNANPYNIRAVSNSWGSSSAYDPDNAINQVTRKIVHDNNVAVIFAAGNDGADNHDGHTITTNPYSLEPGVISVAAIARDGSGMASFSSRGQAQENFTWPDIGAPGVSIWATEARKTLISAMTKQTPGDLMDGYYMSISGTSMATPHVSGLAALLFQAAPELRSSEFYDDNNYEGDMGEFFENYWDNPYNTMHEVEAIMKLTADYISPAADNGVPSNYSINFNSQPNDYAQGYGLTNAQKAVALALTLQEMRRTDNSVTLMDAYYRYMNITTNGTSESDTNVLTTSWKGDWSIFTDPSNLASSFTTQHPRSVYLHNATSRIIVDLTYEPISTTDLYTSTLWIAIDYNGDGSSDWTGDSSFSTDGIKHDEIELGGGGAEAGQFWEFNIEGRAANIPRFTDPNLGSNEFNEAIIEYTVSLQMVIDVGEGETVIYETGDYHAKVAQPEFGEPTPEFHGNGSISMPTMFFDLSQIYPKEAPAPKKDTGDEFPWWIILVLVVVCGLIGAYFLRGRVAQKGASQTSEGGAQEATDAQQASQAPSGEVVEVEAVQEQAPG
jgi:serine protease AprX